MSPDPHDPPGHDVAVLDEQALARLVQLDPDGSKGLMRRVFGAYCGALDRLRVQIADGLAAADWAALRQCAHTLKSSSASIGALDLSRQCAALETAARDQRSDALPAMVAQIQLEIDRVERAVSRLVADRPPAR